MITSLRIQLPVGLDRSDRQPRMLRINRANLIRSTSSVRLLWNDARLFNENKTTETRASEEADTDVLIRTVDINESPRASGSDSFLENYKSTPRYKSKYDLANIYPNSTLDFTREVKVSSRISSTFYSHGYYLYDLTCDLMSFSFSPARNSHPPKPPKGEENKFNGYIPIEQLHFSFARSSGPGGQNVNKVNSKVTVQVDLNKAGWISEPTKEKLKEIVSLTERSSQTLPDDFGTS